MERIKKDGEHLAREVFPQKALELDQLIAGPLMDTKNLEKIGEQNDFPMPEELIVAKSDEKENEQQTKKRKIDNLVKTGDHEINGCKVLLYPGGTIKSNTMITDLLKIIKPYVIHLLDSSAVLKLWIQILMPQIEDFKAELSLQIQEDSLAEIRSIEAEVATYLDHFFKYHSVRGKLVSKVAKYPHVYDYRQSINELDEKMYMTARLVALELRNHYTTVHDILMKNLEKIKKPRVNNSLTMY